MRDFVKRDLAMQIKTDLSKFSVNILTEYAFEVVDDVFRKFCQLNNIGVYITGNGADNIIYHFVKDNGYSVSPRWGDTITEVRDARLFVSLTANHDWNAMVTRAISNVERRFHFKPWQSYLYDSDWDPMRPSRIPMKSTLHDDGVDAIRYSINSIVPRTGGPGREALERIMRTSQYVDVDSMYPKFSDSILRYCKEDWKKTMNLYKRLEEEKKNTIKKVIFHDPATIIYWEDGTKTVVKVQNGEKFDPEKGMAMAICKKTHGNDGSYYEAFKKFLPKEEKVGVFDFDVCLHVFAEIQNLEIVGPDPESGVIKLIDMLNDDRVYAVVDRKTITADEWDALHDKMLKYFKSPAPKDLNNISDAVTIDTGEAPKVRMRESTIDEELKEFAAISGLTVNYEPKTGRYYIFKHQHCKPFVYKADSPEKKLSCLEWAKLQDDIFEYFDI